MSFPRMPRLNPCLPCVMKNPDETDEWLPASRAKEFSPDAYDFVWNADYTKFMAFPLRWTDDASYARYQSGADFQSDNPRGKGPWVVWHKPTGCAKVRNGRDEEARLRAAGYREVAQYKSHADADRVADAVWGGRFNPKVMDAKTKDYRCWFCNGAIDVGEKYEVLRGKPYHLGCYEGKKSGEKSWLQKNRNPKLLVLNPSSSVERAAEKKLGRRLSAAESRNLAQAVKEYREFHGRDPETIIPVEVPDGTPKFVNLVGDVDRVDYTVKANSDRRGRWTHKAGDHGRTAKKTIPAFLVSVPGKKAPPVFAQRKDSKMYFKPSHGIMG